VKIQQQPTTILCGWGGNEESDSDGVYTF